MSKDPLLLLKDPRKELIPEGWTMVRIGDFATLLAGGTPNTHFLDYWENGDIQWMRSGDIHKRRIFEVDGRITKAGLQNSNATLLPIDSVLVALAGQGKTRGTVAINKIELSTNQSVAAIIPKKEIDPEFLFYNLDVRYEHLRRLSTGDGGRGGLNLQILKDVLCVLPPLSEQRKIAEILSTWDEDIAYTERLVVAQQQRKKGLMQLLLTGQFRFAGFEGEWRVMELGEFLIPTLRKVKKPKDGYLRLGVRSHGKGTFTTTMDDEDSDAVAMTHLYQVKEGDLIVSITFAWEGAIAMVGEDGDGALVSHRFPTYTFNKNKVLPEFFRYVMLTKRFFYDLVLISPGGAGRNRVMSKTDFLKLKIQVPSIEEQLKIGATLVATDEYIDILSQKLEALKQQKRGVMQHLLTGKVRVKVD